MNCLRVLADIVLATGQIAEAGAGGGVVAAECIPHSRSRSQLHAVRVGSIIQGGGAEVLAGVFAAGGADGSDREGISITPPVAARVHKLLVAVLARTHLSLHGWCGRPIDRRTLTAVTSRQAVVQRRI
jgi:hypothetical protein